MPQYNEYFDEAQTNESECEQYLHPIPGYYNYQDFNYSHKNHSDGLGGTGYYNYNDDCTAGYDDVQECTVNLIYHDHRNDVNINNGIKTAGDLEISWSSPWGGIEKDRSLESTYIEQSVEGIKQLRDNISKLQGKLHGGAPGSTGAHLPEEIINFPDSDINDTDPATPEFVTEEMHDQLRSNLDNLWTALKEGRPGEQPTTGIIDVEEHKKINKTDWEELANGVDELSAYLDPTYVNHIDTGNL